MTGMFSAAALLATSGVTLAQQDSIRLEHKAEQWEIVKDADGTERRELVEAARVLPGEEVLFTVSYTNVGAQPAEDLTITNPVPDHMDYVDNSASNGSASVTFSVDGGQTFGTPQELSVTGADGEQRMAAAAEYTHVRWVLDGDVAPGASGTVQFTAVVE